LKLVGVFQSVLTKKGKVENVIVEEFGAGFNDF